MKSLVLSSGHSLFHSHLLAALEGEQLHGGRGEEEVMVAQERLQASLGRL